MTQEQTTRLALVWMTMTPRRLQLAQSRARAAHRRHGWVMELQLPRRAISQSWQEPSTPSIISPISYIPAVETQHFPLAGLVRL